jgi:hypothetical protein
MSNSVFERLRVPGRRKSARLHSAAALHYHWTSFDDRKGFSEAFDARADHFSGTEVKEDHMIFGMVDGLFERKFQLDAAPSGQAALKH